MTREFTIEASEGAELHGWELLPPKGEPSPEAPTVVLAHGWTLTSQSWGPVVEELHQHRQVRVVVFDQRGHGRSSMGRQEPSVRMLGDDLRAVIIAEVPRGPIILGGHSMGGMTVMAYAGLHNRSFTKRVRGVMLASTAASIQGRSPIPLERLVMGVASRAPRLAPGPLVPATVQGRLLFGDGARKEDIKVAVRQIQRTKMPTIGKYFNALGAHDEVAALAHFVDVPTHIFVGSQDRLTPVRYSKMLRDAMPHADLTVLPDLGHMLTYEAPVVLADALIALIDAAQAPAA